jgi:hypothetical protein
MNKEERLLVIIASNCLENKLSELPLTSTFSFAGISLSNTLHNELGIEVFYHHHTATSTVPFIQASER